MNDLNSVFFAKPWDVGWPVSSDANRLRCASVRLPLEENARKFHALALGDADRVLSYKICEATFEPIQLTKPIRSAKDSQPRGVWLG